jgi:hypothetical protein
MMNRFNFKLCFQFQLASLNNGTVVAMGSPFTLGVLVCQIHPTDAAAATIITAAAASARTH